MSATNGKQVLFLPVHMLKPGKSDRIQVTPQLQELAASIRELGILQPLTVRKTGDGYTVVSGNRRLVGARLAGLSSVPCLVTDMAEQDDALLSLAENLQRQDLHYFEEAELIQTYISRSGITQYEVARRLGRSQSAIANKLRLLQHTPKVRFALREQGLSERHARELLRIGGETERLLVLEVMAEKHMSILQAERYIDVYLKNRQHSGEERRRLREARLYLERLDRDTALLRNIGIAAQMERREDAREIVLTVRIPQDYGIKA